MNMKMCAFFGKMHEFLLALKRAGCTDDLIREIINSKDNVMAKKMVAAVGSVQKGEKEKRTVYLCTVDHNVSIKRMIKNANFDVVGEDVNSRVLCKNEIQGSVVTSFEIFRVDHWMTSREVLEEMETENLFPANNVELLCCAAKYRIFCTLISLQSVWRKNGLQAALVFDGSSDLKKIFLLEWNSLWPPDTCFLVKAKETKEAL